MTMKPGISLALGALGHALQFLRRTCDLGQGS